MVSRRCFLEYNLRKTATEAALCVLLLLAWSMLTCIVFSTLLFESFVLYCIFKIKFTITFSTTGLELLVSVCTKNLERKTNRKGIMFYHHRSIVPISTYCRSRLNFDRTAVRNCDLNNLVRPCRFWQTSSVLVRKQSCWCRPKDPAPQSSSNVMHRKDTHEIRSDR